MSDQQHTIVIRLPVELHEAVKTKATSEDRSVAQAVREALRRYVKGTR